MPTGPDVGKIGLPIPFNNLGEIVSTLLNIAYVAAGVFFPYPSSNWRNKLDKCRW